MERKTDSEIKSIIKSEELKPPAKVSKAPSSNRIKSSDYQAWDRFDVDKEVELIDLEERPSAPAIITKSKKLEIDSRLTAAQRQFFALNEKNKGNDCLRVEEFEDALHHYSKSIELDPVLATYNNRALVHLKLNNYDRCIDDCSKSLAIETNFKALLRRSQAYFSIGKYQNATIDVDQAIEIEPSSNEAFSLRKKITDKWSDVDGTAIVPVKASKKGKMKIVEVEENTSSIPTIAELLQQEVENNDDGLLDIKNLLLQETCRLQIEDVEDDSSDDD